MRVLIQNLSPGVDYNVQFRARSVDKVSEWSRSFIIEAEGDVVPPKTPTDFGVDVVGSSFYAHWTQVLLSADDTPAYDADHYRLKIETSDGLVAYKTIPYDHGKQNETDTVDFILTYTQNKSFFINPKPDLTFSVQAVDKFGNASPFTGPVSVSNPPPGPPTDFVVTGGLETIYGTWTPPVDDDLFEYRVYMGTTADFAPTAENLIYHGPVAQFTMPSTTYNADLWFKLVAVDIFNSESAVVEAGPVQVRSTTGGDVTPPDAPTLTDVTMTAGDNSANAQLTWTVPASDNDLAGFTIAYHEVGAVDWTYVSADGEATGTTIDNLAFGTNYEFKVRAYDYSFNQSAWSATVGPRSASPEPLPKPATPTVSAAEAIGMQVVQPLSGIPSYANAFEVYVVTNATDTPSGGPVGTISIFNSSLTQVVETFESITADGKYVKTRAVSDVTGPSPFSDAAGPVAIGKLDWNFIKNVQVVNAQIQNLGADKIIGGNGFLNNISIKSTFTLGDSTTDGAIQSFDYKAGVSGFKLAKSGLEINDGAIAAKALNIQFGNNLVHAAYADFEWQPTFYDSMPVSNLSKTISPSGAKYNSQYLTVTRTGTATAYVRFAESATDYNIALDAGESYILSAWVRLGTGTTPRLRLACNDGTYLGSIEVPDATTTDVNGWTRLYGVVTVPAGVTSAHVILYITNTAVGSYVDIDGIQLEKQITTSTKPSVWSPPSSTTIDGGQIRTGEIRSNANVTVNGTQQPAWLINTNGGAQFGDMLIRGNAVVGTLEDGASSIIQSANYIPNVAGWIIRSDGYAEFRDLAINSLTSKALDKPVQNIISTKLYDYMEDDTLWAVRQGSMVGKTNVTGAYSAKALLEMTGDTVVTRDAFGVSQGIAFEPETLYRITGRVRTVDDDNNTQIPLASIGVVGYNDAGELCGYDGSTDLDKQYEIAASRKPMSQFQGAETESAGWVTYIGYLRGRSGAIGQTVWGSPLTDANSDGRFDDFSLYSKGEPNTIASGDFEGDVAVMSQAVNLFPDPGFEYHDNTWYSHGSNTTPEIISGSWLISGAKSYRLNATSATGAKTNSVYIFPSSTSSPRQPVTNQGGMYPGGTFTIAATIRVTSTVAAASLSDGFGRIIPGYRTTAGDIVYDTGEKSDSPPNVPGVYRMQTTFTVPDDSDYVFIRLMLGHNDTSAPVVWDDVVIREGIYTEDEMLPFSGDTAADGTYTYAWQGTAGSSFSTRTGGEGWTQYSSGTLGQMVLTQDNAISGGQSLMITGGTGSSRGAYYDLATGERAVAGDKIKVGFTGRQLLGTGDVSQSTWRIGLANGSTVWQTIDVPAHPDDNPMTHTYALTVPTGSTLSRIYVYNNGLPVGGSAGSTILDDVFIVADASPTTAIVNGAQRLTADLPEDVQSGVQVIVPEPEIDSYLAVDFANLTPGARVGMSVETDAGGVVELGRAEQGDVTSGMLTLRLKTGVGDTLTIDFYVTSPDEMIASVDLSNFRLITGIGESPDQYNPAAVHDNVRFIAPYVRLNEGAPTKVSQLDAFTIETFEAGNQQKVATSLGYGGKAITIENIEGDDENVDHAIRFFTGEASEVKPGVIAHYVDGDRDDSLSLLITAPRANEDVADYTDDAIVMQSRNSNLLSNSGFESESMDQWMTWRDTADAQVNLIDYDDVYDGSCSARVRVTDATKSTGLRHAVNLSDFPALAGATKISGSAYVKYGTPDDSAVAPHNMLFRMEIRVYAATDTGYQLINPGGSRDYFITPTAWTVSPDAEDWTRLEYTWNYTIPEEAAKVELLVGTYAPDAGVVNGDEYLVDNVQFELGDVTPYKPQRPSRLVVSTDVSFIKNGLVLAKDDIPLSIPWSENDKSMTSPGRPAVPNNPRLFMIDESAIYTLGPYTYQSDSDESRSFLEMAGHDVDGTTRNSPVVRLFSVNDSVVPGQYQVLNSNGAWVMQTEDKFGNVDNSASTRDIRVAGHVRWDADGPWEVINAHSPFSHATDAYTFSAYKNGDIVYLRGALNWNGTGDFTGNKTWATLPAKFRPPRPVRFVLQPFNKGANLGSFVLAIGTDGTMVNYYEDTGYNTIFGTGGQISLDGLWFSTAPDLPATSSPTNNAQAPDPVVNPADTTPPSKPSNFSINARSSGASTGSYTLKWTNSGSGDSAGVKIIWRTDRYPSITIPNSGKRTLKTDGHVITVSGSSGAKKSYTHTSLPVNRTIYYRVVAYDKSGNHSGYISGKRYLLKSPIVVTADSSHTYRTSYGGTWDGPPGSGDDMYQGDGGYTGNNYRGCWFYGGMFYNQLNKGGVRRTPTKATIYAYRQNSAHGTTAAATVHLWWHPHANRPGGAPDLHDERRMVDLKRGQGKTFNLPSGWLKAMSTGTIRGFGVYTTVSSDYIIYTGHSDYKNNGKVTIYHKG